MYRFQVNAATQAGESIGVVGSTPELGMWDVTQCIPLHTSGDRYPIWWVDIHISQETAVTNQKLEYKYVLLGADGSVKWETNGRNRWVPIELDNDLGTIVVDDGAFGNVPTSPYGYFESPVPQMPLTRGVQGLKIAVIGSSVAMGCNAWLLQGWAWDLQQELNQKYGHILVNLSELGADVTRTINRFSQTVAPQKPDVVIIALSLGNEGLAYCPPYQRRAVQRRFESGLQQLVKMTQELGARPILGAVYPHGDYSSEHNWLLRDTHNRMLSWGVPVLNWLDAVDDGGGRWKPGTASDVAHPNMEGHRLMYEAIDIRLFQMTHDQFATAKPVSTPHNGLQIYRDKQGFAVLAVLAEKSLRVINQSQYTYTITPDWHSLQAAIQRKARLMPGIYIAKNASAGTLPFFSVRSDGTIETAVDISPGADLEYSAAFNFFSPHVSQILFYDGSLGILKEKENFIRVINETEHEYNIHPMWKEVRGALKAMPAGVYEDAIHPDVPFRTMMIGAEGLESRVKVPPKSSVLFEYKCKLSDISRVAILPIGDRCAPRMLLYKMQYDGPAFPFDLTRSSNLGDVIDIIDKDFADMWNPDLLRYEPSDNRLYHKKWSGLSFGHEVEDTDQPRQNMSPIYERMRDRYSARAHRFLWTLRHCDEVLFIRTGGTTRGYVLELVKMLESKLQGKPFRVLLISPQSSAEFADIPHILHYDREFNPDKMYADAGHWMHCTEVMREILDELGISSKNLFWCPPNPPKDKP
ncbi:MAG TPA: lipase [Oscillatoriaceae cyanobacterium M33_DOE_052]|uniref:Lipase n=1 Tax=Planktothricoides sp. SpSt-374 TaxID=2282167 RepID=A0A7C3ZN10_9CYAN|nr:lipase [Oscillatoriaceae cyanobacterium M33_DOE_052]